MSAAACRCNALMELHLLSSPFWIPLCLALGAAYAFILYRQPSSFSTPVRRLLMAFRFLSVSLLAMLLLRPMLTWTQKITEDPILLILVDDSESMMANPDSSQIRQFLNQDLQPWIKENQTGYNILAFAFSDVVKSNPDAFAFQGQSSNLSLALEQLQTQFANQRVAAGLLISDGMFNQGNNPVFVAENSPFPWFSMGCGDTTTLADAGIIDLQANPIAFLGNRFPIRVRMSVELMPVQSFTLSLSNKKTNLRQSVQLSAPNPRQTLEHIFYVEASSLGMQTFTAELLPLTGDKIPANNKASISIEVLDDRKKIALIAAAPHPDIAAITAAAERSEDLQVEAFRLSQTPPNLEEFDAFILHGITAQNSIPPALKTALDQGMACWWISGSEHSSGLFAALNPGLQTAFSANSDLVFASPSAGFTLFQTPADWTPETWPPLLAPFGNYTLQPGSTVFQYKKLGSVVSQQPLWVFRDLNGRRSSVLMGEGLWKWRIALLKENGNSKGFDETIGMILQWLSLKEERRRFMVKTRKRHAEGSPVLFQAEVLDAALQPVADANVSIKITDELGKQWNYPFQAGSPGYSLQVQGLASGRYEYTAKVESMNEIPELRGSFVVEKTSLEGLQKQANHTLLSDISSSSGGRLLPFADTQSLESIVQDLEIPSISRAVTDQFPIWKSLWPLVLLLVLLLGEWTLRKFYGRI